MDIEEFQRLLMNPTDPSESEPVLVVSEEP